MKSKEIRKRFFAFFKKHGHELVPSSSLIPAQDPTLLFTNAGMNQFKDLFLGNEKRSYTRATSIQKCVRAGGKHNDLDNVGFTKRHLTFFEMMGNFSFGDYFKKEAIQFAWDFLTKDMGLPVDKLHASVFTQDDDSYNLWLTMIKLPEERIHRLGAEENFWSMGDLGPCGPCTELYLDRGTDPSCSDQKNCAPGCECDRFLEIWNLVFMQYDRQQDGSLKPLKQTGVDTGMGLERLCSVVQNKDSVFETDLFAPIIEKTEQLTGLRYEQQNKAYKAAFHVLADHIRSSTLLISDGCAPSNDGRGYVLRKIIRRGALFAQRLTDKNIFPALAHVVIEQMGDIYPELQANAQLIIKILESEIQKFTTNLTRGSAILQEYFKEGLKQKTITGQQAFKLYDTFGFPIESITAMAREQDYTVDMKGFEKLMEQQRAQSGAKTEDLLCHIDFDKEITSKFTGYQELETSSDIIALVHNNKPVTAVPKGQKCFVIAQKSPFFIVGGGQVPDNGWLVLVEHKIPLLSVRYINNGIAAEIKAPVNIKVGDAVTSIVHEEKRVNAMKNHTATHLLQSALITLFGKTIKQSGSLVHPDYLRFDFSYHENLKPADIKQVEDLVNEKIRENIPVNTAYTSLKQALEQGALAFFGDKYNPEQVRMVQVSDFSTELCGGTHVPATGVIGTFKIMEVTALSAGHRRIFAVTGPKAIELFQDTFDTVTHLRQEFKVKREEVLDTVRNQKEQLRKLQTAFKQLKSTLWKSQLPVWEQQVAPINKLPYLFLKLDNIAHDELKEIANSLAQKQPGFYFLISTANGRTNFLCLLSEQHTSKFDLQAFASWLKDTHGLRGGGRKNSLQGGGSVYNPALEGSVKQWLAQNVR